MVKGNLRFWVGAITSASVMALNTHPAGAQTGFSFDDGARHGSFQYTLEHPGEDGGGWEMAGSAPAVVASTELQVNQNRADSGWHFANTYHSKESIFQLGASFKGSRIDGFSGEGQTQARARHHYTDVDPFLFHGGTDQKFDFSGVSLSQQFFKARLGLTYANIQSDGLEDRSVYGLGISGSRYDLSLMQVDRGQDHIGSVLSFAVDASNYRIGLDYMEQDNGAALHRLNVSTHHRGKHYRVTLQSTENPLYDLKNENKVVFSMGFNFGAKSKGLYATDSEGEQEEEESNKNSYLIGAVAVGAGVALSSGSGGGDNNVRQATQHEAARVVLNRINPESVRLNREHGGYVYRNADGSYSSTEPILGETASILLPNPVFITPAGTVTTASYHTHGGPDPRYDNENFSPQDLYSDRLLGLDGYLGTPGGLFKYHNVRTDEISTLGTIAN